MKCKSLILGLHRPEEGGAGPRPSLWHLWSAQAEVIQVHQGRAGPGTSVADIVVSPLSVKRVPYGILQTDRAVSKITDETQRR